MVLGSWPYPFWIAHRGGGNAAPENTLAGFREGLARGFTMFECDANLTSDGEVVLLHDSTLDRTTSGQGWLSETTWPQLARLDAGSWHGGRFAGERVPRLHEVAAFCHRTSTWVNLEIKPSPGGETLTGQRVAQHAERLWLGRDPAQQPLLSSFSPAALEAARSAAPGLPRALLRDSLDCDWLGQAQALGCRAVVLEQALFEPSLVAQVHAVGLRCLAYTVNNRSRAARLQAMGVDGLITDNLDLR